MSGDEPAKGWLWGEHAPIGARVALATFALDQAHKWWMLLGYGIAEKGRIAVNRYLDLVYKKNTGISYSMLDMASYRWQLALAAFAVIASAAMWVWLVRGATSRLMAMSVALIIGGALGNGLDRVLLGGVADFFSVHFPWGGEEFYWYVFNIADCAIVAGVAGLLYDSARTSRNDAAKSG